MLILLPPSANVRRLTVLKRYLSRSRTRTTFECVPDIHLRGKWLALHGFRSGHTIDITCEDEKLIITLSQQQRFYGL